MSDQKRGLWLRPTGATKASYRFICRRCGKTAHQVTGNCRAELKNRQCTYKFCPFCGAPMTPWKFGTAATVDYTKTEKQEERP